MLRVLIVDIPPGLRSAVERALRQADMETLAVDGFEAARAAVRQHAFDAVVSDLRGPAGLALLQWLGSYTPSTRIVAATEVATEEFLRAYGSASTVRIVQRLDPEIVLAQLRDLGPRRGFYGNSIEIELFDYVQMIALTGRDKLIEVLTPRGTGRIWFEHGDIVHVEYANLRGERAFYELLAVGKGEFCEVFGLPPPMHTVTRSSIHLLMEAARQADEGTLGDPNLPLPGEAEPDADDGEEEVVLAEEEVSFADLNDEDEFAVAREPESRTTKLMPGMPPPPPSQSQRSRIPPVASEDEDEDFAALVEDSLIERIQDEPRPVPRPTTGSIQADSQAGMSTVSGHTIFDDPDMRSVMLDQFWQFEGINGVAIISSTGKVLAEDMRNNSSLVTLAGFYMRGAARIARNLGHNVFDGVVARSVNGQQMVMVSMGAASAVLSVAPGADPEAVRDAVMGVD